MDAGNWSSDTIVEDSDLGLTLLEHGWIAHYTNRRYGYGLLPDTYDAFRRQRHRWAFGGLQILRKHWHSLLPWSQGLSPEQKREYGVGWLNWLGAESIGVVVALLNIVWVPLVVFGNYQLTDSVVHSRILFWLHQFGAVPDRILTVPILAAFAVSVAHFAALYHLRVRASAGQMIGAVCAAMSVQWTVARAVGIGVFKEHLPFLRTSKGGNSRKGADFPGLLGSDHRRPASDRRCRARRHQPPAGARNQHLRLRARGAEPAVPRRGRHEPARRQPAQLVRLLAVARGAGRALC